MPNGLTSMIWSQRRVSDVLPSTPGNTHLSSEGPPHEPSVGRVPRPGVDASLDKLVARELAESDTVGS